MEAFLQTIGTLIVGAIFIVIPILMPVSFIFDWYYLIKLFFVVGTVIDYILVCNMICDLAVK